MEIPEFTDLCPKTSYRDFAMLIVDDLLDKSGIEFKNLKPYIWSFRNEGHFHADRILDNRVRGG